MRQAVRVRGRGQTEAAMQAVQEGWPIVTIRGSLGDYMGSEPTEEQSKAMAWMRSIEVVPNVGDASLLAEYGAHVRREVAEAIAEEIEAVGGWLPSSRGAAIARRHGGAK